MREQKRNKNYSGKYSNVNESEKDTVTKEIISVISAIEKVRKDIKLCDEVSDNSKKIKEQIKEMKEKKQEKVRVKEKRLENMIDKIGTKMCQ